MHCAACAVKHSFVFEVKKPLPPISRMRWLPFFAANAAALIPRLAYSGLISKPSVITRTLMRVSGANPACANALRQCKEDLASMVKGRFMMVYDILKDADETSRVFAPSLPAL
jgi:hypothetical protein